MANIKKTRPNLKIEIIDKNGNHVAGERRRARVNWSEIFSNILMALGARFNLLKQAITRWWQDLTKVPPKMTKAEEKAKIMKDTRDQITFTAIIAVIVIFLKMPPLLTLTFEFEALLMIMDAAAQRIGLAEGEKPSKTRKRSAKGVGRLMTGYLIWVALLTVIAWAVKNGHLVSVTETFPWLKSFANWQVSQINETVEFVKEHLFFKK